MIVFLTLGLRASLYTFLYEHPSIRRVDKKTYLDWLKSWMQALNAPCPHTYPVVMVMNKSLKANHFSACTTVVLCVPCFDRQRLLCQRRRRKSWKKSIFSKSCLAKDINLTLHCHFFVIYIHYCFAITWTDIFSMPVWASKNTKNKLASNSVWDYFTYITHQFDRFRGYVYHRVYWKFMNLKKIIINATISEWIVINWRKIIMEMKSKVFFIFPLNRFRQIDGFRKPRKMVANTK